MRIVCPACAATYQVPDGRLLPGRVVRCARCDTDWAPIAEEVVEPVAEPEKLPEPEPHFVERAVVEPEPEVVVKVVSVDQRFATSGGAKQAAALRAAWVLSAAVVLGVVWFGYSARDAVMRVWPPSVRAYAALGLVGKN